MAKVVAKMKIFPSDVGIDLEKLKGDLGKSLPDGAQMLHFDEEPIAFGLIALVATVSMMEETDGLMDRVENALKSCPNVGEVQTVAIGRM